MIPLPPLTGQPHLADSNLTLTSTDGITAVDETVTVTFTGAAGNHWVDDSGGNQTISPAGDPDRYPKNGKFQLRY